MVRKYRRKRVNKSIPQKWFQKMQAAQEHNTQIKCSIARYVITHKYDEDTRLLLNGVFKGLMRQTDILLDFCEGKL